MILQSVPFPLILVQKIASKKKNAWHILNLSTALAVMAIVEGDGNCTMFASRLLTISKLLPADGIEYGLGDPPRCMAKGVESSVSATVPDCKSNCVAYDISQRQSRWWRRR
jgi:hypothetical protein